MNTKLVLHDFTQRLLNRDLFVNRTVGIDKSFWDGQFNKDVVESAVNAGKIQFAYLMAGWGSSTNYDKTLDANYRLFTDLGIPVGLIWWLTPTDDVKAQLYAFMRAETMYPCRLLSWGDFEDKGFTDPNKFRVMTYQFLDSYSQTRGYPLVFYSNPDTIKRLVQGYALFKPFPLAIANYAVISPEVPSPWQKWTFWQYTDRLPGKDYGNTETKEMDGDYFNGDLSELLALKWDFPGSSNPNPPQQTVGPLSYRVTVQELMIRTYPNINAPYVSKLYRGDIVTAEAFDGNDVWIRHSRGWSCIRNPAGTYMEVVQP